MTRPDSVLALTSAISKSRLRLLPFLILMYILAFIDRSNVGFAKAALQSDNQRKILSHARIRLVAGHCPPQRCFALLQILGERVGEAQI